MADHIDGPLYYERMGRTGPVMAFVHPNPMDQSCWIFQMAHMSTWFRCIAIDIPGYGRSPKARDGTWRRAAGRRSRWSFPRSPRS
jgi:pimeloyl-ACP methyl ester carboxylesterase